jgi:hypothetical protein
MMFIELKKHKKSGFILTASVKGLGLKNIASNMQGFMGHTWELLGFIRSVK